MPDQSKLKRVLSLMDATMINVGGILGSGIFMVPATVALYASSSSLFFMVWIIGGIISLFGALSVVTFLVSAPGQSILKNLTDSPNTSMISGEIIRST